MNEAELKIKLLHNNHNLTCFFIYDYLGSLTIIMVIIIIIIIIIINMIK